MQAGTARRVFAGALASLLLFLFLVRLVHVPYVSTAQETSDRTVGELVGATEVGQFFESVRPVLTGVGIRFATYGGRSNTAEVIFELRDASGMGEPLRRVTVSARELRDHQWYTFHFPPLRAPRGSVFYASVRSPSSRLGNAVTVDVSSVNPYRKVGASHAVILRTDRSPEALQRDARPQVDLAFRVQHHIRASERLRIALLGGVQVLRHDPGRLALDGYLQALAFVLALLMVVPLVPLLTRSPWRPPLALGAVVVIGFFWRHYLAQHLPATNDEGFMLYDAWAVSQGRLPGGDGLLKTPVVVSALAAILPGLGFSLAGLRWVSVLAGLLTTFPLARLARASSAAADRGAVGVRTFGLWLLAAAPAVFSIYGHAQPLQVLLGVSGLAALTSALFASARGARRREVLLAAAAGLLFALALGARKSSLAFAAPALLVLLFQPAPWRGRVRVLGITLLATLGIFGVISALLARPYGPGGVRYFLGISLAAVDPATTASLEERASSAIRAVLPYFREGLPLTVLALLGLGALLEASASLPRRVPRFVARLLWVVPLLLAFAAQRFFFAHEREELHRFGVSAFWIMLPWLVAVAALWPRQEGARVRARTLGLQLGVPVAWLLALAVLYGGWIKLSPNYLAEFLPPLVLLSVAGAQWAAARLRVRRLALPLLGLALVWAAYSSARSTATFEHTGTFELSALREMGGAIVRNVPTGEPILTGALVLAVSTGHPVPFDVAHPTHYAYGYIEPEVRNIYLAPVEALVPRVLQDIRWVLLERLTAFSYFREYPEIERHVAERFREIARVENGGNPLVLLARDDVVVEGTRAP